MEDAFDEMIRERLKDALEHAWRSHALESLPLPQDTIRHRLQVQLGDLLISVGERLRQSDRPASHSTTWS